MASATGTQTIQAAAAAPPKTQTAFAVLCLLCRRLARFAATAASLILLAFAATGGAHAQESGDLTGEVLSSQEAQEKIAEDLINRAFGWSEMFIVPGKLTMSVGTVATIYVRNKSSDPRDFRIIKEEPKEEGEADMRQYIRFGPRSFRLQPEQTQVVKLIARKPPEDIEPKWRQRFSVQLLPLVEDREEDEELEEGQVSFRVRGIYAVSMPVDVIP